MPPVTFMPQTVGARTGFTTTERPAKIGVDPGRIWIVVTPFDSARSNAMSCAFTAEIGRAHVCTPVTNAHLVCRLLLEKKNMPTTIHNDYRADTTELPTQ